MSVFRDLMMGTSDKPVYADFGKGQQIASDVKGSFLSQLLGVDRPGGSMGGPNMDFLSMLLSQHDPYFQAQGLRGQEVLGVQEGRPGFGTPLLNLLGSAAGSIWGPMGSKIGSDIGTSIGSFGDSQNTKFRMPGGLG